MSLSLGTNCGFVTSAPSSDPSASYATWDGFAIGFKVTSPAGSNDLTEIGWWVDLVDTPGTFDVAIYSHDSGNDWPGSILASTTGTSTGSSAGVWKAASINYSMTASTTYWLVVQMDAVAGAIRSNDQQPGGEHYEWLTASELPTWDGSGGGNTNILVAIYGLYSAAASPVTMPYVNIGDAWKNIDEVFINIGDAWKTVSEVYVNVGDAWKEVI